MAIINLVTGFFLPFVAIISLIVFIHEMGHYLVGRWSGIRVLAFSIGFGPELIGFNDRHGTRWKISLIPLGGYVRFFGDADAASKADADAVAGLSPEERAQTLNGAKLWKRAATVAAGPIANFLLAIVIFTVIFAIYGKTVSDPVVSDVVPDSAAAVAGVQSGDILRSLDGNKVETFDDVVRYITMRPDMPVQLGLQRGDQTITMVVTPRRATVEDRFGNKMEVGQIGIRTTAQSGNFRVENLSPGQAFVESVLQIGHIVTGTYDYIHNVIVGRMKPDQLGGPIRVAEASGQVATLGVAAMLQFAAVLSVSIGLLNLLPIPVLDGGHLFLYALEAVRGKPISAGAQEIAFRIGFALLLTLMVFVTWNDIGRHLG